MAGWGGHTYQQHTFNHTMEQRMAYVVTVMNKGTQFWLRGTTWAFHRDRANVFETQEAAQAAIAKASKFIHATIRKNLQIVEA